MEGNGRIGILAVKDGRVACDAMADGDATSDEAACLPVSVSRGESDRTED